MADILIRGMEMPKKGCECPMNSFGICHVATDGENCECYDVRPEWCPLLPLPNDTIKAWNRRADNGSKTN